MDFDGTLSTELAMLRKQKDEYNDVVTMPPQLDNNGQQMVTQIGIVATMIPKGAKNIELAKDFIKYVLQPEINNEFLKGGLAAISRPGWKSSRTTHGGATPSATSTCRPMSSRAWSTRPSPDYFAYNPAWAQVRSEHTFHVAFHEIVADGKPVKEAVDKAMKRVEEIFTKYPIEEA